MAFEDFDFTSFWDDCESALRDYVEAYPDDAMVESVEAEVGFRLPASAVRPARSWVTAGVFAEGWPAGWAEGWLAAPAAVGGVCRASRAGRAGRPG